MTVTITPPTERQLSYLRNLVAQKQMPAEVRAGAELAMSQPDFTKAQASRFIDRLSTLQDKPREARPAPAAKAHLVGLPHSKYALVRADMGSAAHLVRPDNDLGFFEVKEYRGTVYMRQLHGAPGSFNRVRVDSVDELAVAALIAKAPLEGAQRFAAHYSCCARCGAELTDQTSRELGLGPTCRAQFGL